jgi:hypothetical protein
VGHKEGTSGELLDDAMLSRKIECVSFACFPFPQSTVCREAKETECFLPLLLLEGAASGMKEERAGGFELELD